MVIGCWRVGAAPASAGRDAGGGAGIYADDAERERAVRYNRAREWLTLAGLAWGGATALLALTTGLSARLRDRAARVAPRRLGPPMPYALATALLSTLASLPLAYYGGYTLEHRYGLSNQSRRAWAADQLKG